MPADPAPHGRTPLLVSSKEEQILEAVRTLGFTTAQDITQLLFSPGSRNHVRAILTKLAGGEDFATGHFLYRFPLPATTRGAKERVYTLGATGRELLTVSDYYRPYKHRYLPFSHIMHDVCLARLVCSAHVWCRARTQTASQVRLVETRLHQYLSRELCHTGPTTQRTPAAVSVVPDAFLQFELLHQGVHTHYQPILVELDRGSEYKKRFQQHVADRIDFIRSGQYARFFGVDAVRIAYVSVRSRSEPLRSRLSAMRAWTKELLTELKLAEWSDVFYFSSLIYENLYTLSHFEARVWYTSSDPTPKRLLEP